jgi:hypothetical protein
MTTSHNAPGIFGSSTDDPPTAIWRSGSKRSNGCGLPPRLRARKIPTPFHRWVVRRPNRRALPSEPVLLYFARHLCPPGPAPRPCSDHAAGPAIRCGLSRDQPRRSGSRCVTGPHPCGRRRSRGSRNRCFSAEKRRLPGGLCGRWRSRLGRPLLRPPRPADHRSRNAQTDRTGTAAESAGRPPPFAGDHDLGMPATGRSGSGIVATTRSGAAKALFHRRAAGNSAGALARKAGRFTDRSAGGLAGHFPPNLRPTPVILKNRQVTATNVARAARPTDRWPRVRTKP